MSAYDPEADDDVDWEPSPPLSEFPLNNTKITLNCTYEDERSQEPSGFCIIIDFSRIEEVDGRAAALATAGKYADALARNLQLPRGGKFNVAEGNHFTAPDGARVMVCHIDAANAAVDVSWAAVVSGAMKEAFDKAHAFAVAQMDRAAAGVAADSVTRNNPGPRRGG